MAFEFRIDNEKREHTLLALLKVLCLRIPEPLDFQNRLARRVRPRNSCTSDCGTLEASPSGRQNLHVTGADGIALSLELGVKLPGLR
jgi:hypothetical protein